MPDLETTYAALRGALVAAIENAWSPVKIYLPPQMIPEEYAGGFPVVVIDRTITNTNDGTFTRDELAIQFTVTGVFENNTTEGNDLEMIQKVTAAQAELYAIANLGDYGYLGQMSDPTAEALEGGNRYVASFTYTCRVSIDRT